jgi:hypothetical protein
MIVFPLWMLALPYLAVAVFVAVMALFTMFHFVKYSETTFVSFVAVLLYLAGTAYILFFTWQALQGTDWRYPVEIKTVFSGSNDAFTL